LILSLSTYPEQVGPLPSDPKACPNMSLTIRSFASELATTLFVHRLGVRCELGQPLSTFRLFKEPKWKPFFVVLGRRGFCLKLVSVSSLLMRS
jgi:hypothetical protein